MKRALALMFTLTLLLTLPLLAGATSAPANRPVVLKLGFSTNEEDCRAVSAKQFAAEVSQKTNGAVRVELYPAGQLGGDAELVSALALELGTVDMIVTDASSFAAYEPRMGVSALPFRFESLDQAWAFMDGAEEAEAEAALTALNIRVLAHYCNGFRCVTSSVGPVNTPADLRGLRIRAAENPVSIATLTALGARAEPLSFTDLYRALWRGELDAQENSIPVIYNSRLYEVQQYLSLTNHIYSGLCLAISEQSFRGLNAECQTALAEAARVSALANRETNRLQTQELLAQLEQKGMIVNTPDRASFVEAIQRAEDEIEALCQQAMYD